MPGWSELAPFALLGLAGAAHCAGMCGGFALAVAVSAGPARRRALARSLAYVLGKAATYALLGLLAARAAELVGRAGGGGDGLEGFRGGLALATGLALALAGARLVGCREVGIGGLQSALISHLGPRFAPLFSAVRALPGTAGALGTGLVTGLLPCGLSWSALALALPAGPVTGTLGPFVFGLATAPALLAVAFGARALPSRWRAFAPRLAGPALIALGLFTALRSGALRSTAAARAALPECCASPAPDGAPRE